MKQYEFKEDYDILKDNVEEDSSVYKKPGIKGTLTGLFSRKKKVLPPDDTPKETVVQPVKPKTIEELALEQVKRRELQKHQSINGITSTQPQSPAITIQSQPTTTILKKQIEPEPQKPQPKQIEPAAPLKPDEQLTIKKGLWSRLFHRKPKEKKQKSIAVTTRTDEQEEIRKKSIYRTVDIAILLFAFLVGAVSVVLVYSELPTHPYLVIGIAGISVSVGIITGINRW